MGRIHGAHWRGEATGVIVAQQTPQMGPAKAAIQWFHGAPSLRTRGMMMMAIPSLWTTNFLLPSM